MPGLQPPAHTPRPLLPRSWLDSSPLSLENDEKGWSERIAQLEVRLGEEVRRLLGECCGDDRREYGWEREALMKAVGQTVKGNN